MQKIIGSLAILGVIGAIAGSGGSKNPSSGGGGGSGSASASTSPAVCTTRATKDCTPSEPENGSVRVDALRWKVLGAQTAQTIGDMTYGGGARAEGVFVIARVRVHSLKGESAELTSDAVKLQVGNRQFSQSDDGMTALEMDDNTTGGANPFVFKQIGPGMTTKGTVVFDVPPSALNKQPQLRFNELGFGSTHAFIDLPAV